MKPHAHHHASTHVTLPVLDRISIAVMKHHDQKASWGGKGLFDLLFHITVHHRRKSGQELKQGRILEVGADAEAVEEVAAGLFCFSIEPLTASPRMAPSTLDWALPIDH